MNSKTISSGLLVVGLVGMGLLELSILRDRHPWYWAGLERTDALAGIMTVLAIAGLLQVLPKKQAAVPIIVGTLLLDVTLVPTANGYLIRRWQVWALLIAVALVAFGMWVGTEGPREGLAAGIIAVLGVSMVLVLVVVLTVLMVDVPWF